MFFTDVEIKILAALALPQPGPAGAREPSMSDPTERRVSVIIPARNEEANVERVVRSVAAQEDVREILVVDDRSVDRTAEILEWLKAQIPALRVVRTGPLPGGWLGKNHAVATGARLATGEWLLFTDADTDHRPGSLRTLVERAEREGADLLSISPGQRTDTWWEKAVIPLIYTRLAKLFRFQEVSDPRSPVAAANGQYILVRRDAYERAGGHDSVRGEILEDVELARRIKSMEPHGRQRDEGSRVVFLPGAAWVTTRMYHRFSEMWNGWTKNLFLLYGRNLGRLLQDVAGVWALDVLPVILLLVAGVALIEKGPAWFNMLVASICLLAAVLTHWRYSRRLRNLEFPSWLAWYLVPGAAIYGLLLLNSARAYCWSGKVVWKDRVYSVKD